MKILYFILIAVFSIFIGSQITEGALFVPYWQSLDGEEFHTYYRNFGPSINQFYTILTITAALIAIGITVYFKVKRSSAFVYALISSIFAILFISAFYLYFKETNELFFESAFSNAELKKELITWSKWHWGRVILECLSLLFLVFAIVKDEQKQ